jgi:hypothetical protein
MALDRNTLPLALAALGLAAEDWGSDWSSYAALSAGWRGAVACPSEAALLAALPDAEAKAAALAEILRLENEVTQRRLREAVLTQDGAAWLAAQEAAIAAQRAIIGGG